MNIFKKKSVNSPVNVAIPNTTELKMKAILDVAAAVKEVALALNSVNVQVTISDNIISNAKGDAIHIGNMRG